jgi:transposase-like protein
MIRRCMARSSNWCRCSKRRFASTRPVGKNWRVEETYIKVRGSWKYLYRAVDKAGNTIDFLFRAKRDKAAAWHFFERAISQNGSPETVTIDRSCSNLAAPNAINAERETPINVRQVKYLSDIVEQDHRAIKRRIRPILGFERADEMPGQSCTIRRRAALLFSIFKHSLAYLHFGALPHDDSSDRLCLQATREVRASRVVPAIPRVCLAHGMSRHHRWRSTTLCCHARLSPAPKTVQRRSTGMPRIDWPGVKRAP